VTTSPAVAADEPGRPTRRFELHRITDITGVSGTGVVADGVVFPDGVVALRWRSDWPTSVVFHDRGIESVQAVHGHGGATRIVWLDMISGPPAPAISMESIWSELEGYVAAAVTSPALGDAAEIRAFMRELKARRQAPIAEWVRKLAAQPAPTPEATA